MTVILPSYTTSSHIEAGEAQASVRRHSSIFFVINPPGSALTDGEAITVEKDVVVEI